MTEASSILVTPMFYLVLLYGAMCLAIYFYRPTSWGDRARAAVFLPIVAYGLMFSSVAWHPQWLIISTPFFALSALFLRRTNLLMMGDVLGGVALIWISVNLFRYNVDSSMLTFGPLRAWFPFVYTGLFSFFPEKFTPFWWVVFHSYLFFPVVLLAAERWACSSGQRLAPAIGGVTARALILVLIFVLPSLATAWMPRSLAARLDPDALIAGLVASGDFAYSAKPAGEIYGIHDVRQHFVAPRDGLQAIGVRLATYARSNTSTIRMRVLDGGGAVIVERRLPAAKIGDSVFQYFDMPTQKNSAGRSYTLILDSEDGAPGNALTVWMGLSPKADAGRKLQLGNTDVPESLAMRLYFSRESNGSD